MNERSEDSAENSTSPRPNENHRRTGMKAIQVALAAALLASSAAAAAQTATDAQCLIVSNAFSRGAKDADAQKAAEATLYFYLGRVGDRMTAAQLKTLLDTEMKTISDKPAGATMNKCVQAVQSKVQLLQSLAPAAPAAKKPEGR